MRANFFFSLRLFRREAKMGKNKHSKDRIYITAAEWATEYGGKKREASSGNQTRPLPFDHCALSLAPFHTPVLLPNDTGVVFDFENIVPYLQKHKCDPVTGREMSTKDIIRLHMSKNSEGQWECPVTNKVFTASSHIVAIRTSGNVYSYDAVLELNIKAKSMLDLIDNSPFTKADIMTLQNPTDLEAMRRRDISSFTHLQQVRADAAIARKAEGSVRHTTSSQAAMAAIQAQQQADLEAGIKKKTTEEIIRGTGDAEGGVDVQRFLDLSPTIEDVNPGQVNTDGKAGGAFTSTAVNMHTSNATRLATAEEIRQARWKIMRRLAKKSYVQLQTTHGNLNIEVYTDMAMCTAWNFLTLCKRSYYDNTVFHRLIPSFVIQGGDPTGKGTGGHSAFPQKQFRDEFDTRLLHNVRGILSMANSGQHTNASQFFITFAPAQHLDFKHPVFGKVVGGLAALDRIEQVGADSKDRPLEEIRILSTAVFSDPLDEADNLLEDFIKENMRRRLSNVVRSALPSADDGEDSRPSKQVKYSHST